MMSDIFTSTIAFPVGMGLLTLLGMSLARLLEGKTPVLGRWERVGVGVLLGTTAGMFAQFVAHVGVGVPLSLIGFLSVQVSVTGIAGFFAWRTAKRHGWAPAVSVYVDRGTAPRWAWMTLTALFAWSGAKILLSGVTFLLLTPAFLDDVIENWNLRAKVFYETQKLTLLLPGQGADMTGGGVNSYAPTVPMAKAWLLQLNNGYCEAIMNSLHLAWYLALLLVAFFALRRMLSLAWSLVGVYALASLPLLTMQGLNPYADVFLAGHILIGAAMLSGALTATDDAKRRSFLRLAALAAALVGFTKNEGLVLYLPALFAATAATFFFLRSTKDKTALMRTGVLFLAMIAAVVVPWLLYKAANGMPFGNAKPLPTDFAWQPQAWLAILVNTFLEANWNFLFVALVVLLCIEWRSILRRGLAPFVVAAGVVYLGQLPLFLFTGLSQEALFQTGYARGVIHIIPMMGVIVTVLAERFVARVKE